MDLPGIEFPEISQNQWIEFGISVVIYLLIGLIVYLALNKWIRKMVEKTETKVDDIILDIIRTPVILIILFYGVKASLYILDIPDDITTHIDRIYDVITIIAITWVAYSVFKKVLIYYGKQLAQKTKSDIDDDLIPIVNKVGGLIIVVFGIMSLLSYMGVNVAIFLAGMGIAGIVIAFAAQDTLSNLFSGIFLLLDRPLKEGDIIVMDNGAYCKVVDIGLRTTKLYDTFDHEYVILPNNILANQKIVNVEWPDRKIKVKVTVGVAYGTPPEKVEKLLLDIAHKHEDVMTDEDHAPWVRFIEFGDSALQFKLYMWTDDFDKQWKLASDVRFAIDQRFKEEGIEIPFPQRVVWHKNPVPK